MGACRVFLREFGVPNAEQKPRNEGIWGLEKAASNRPGSVQGWMLDAVQGGGFVARQGAAGCGFNHVACGDDEV